MATVQHIADSALERGTPGVVAAIVRGDEHDVAVAGSRAVDGEPMTRDTVFRLASLTKPIVGAAAMRLVEMGAIAPTDPVGRWLPELDGVRVLRTQGSTLDDSVPLARAITVEHVLTCTAGVGFVGDLGAPIVAAQGTVLGQGPDPRAKPAADEWMRRLATLPLAHQPGEGWTYDAGMDLLGILLARAARADLADLVAALVLEPLGMRDTGFRLRADQVPRTATSYRLLDGAAVVVETPERLHAAPPAFDSAAGGLVSTLDDQLAFWRMLRDRGRAADGSQVLAETSVATMRSPHAAAEPGNVFLADQAWGVGGGVDVAVREPWTAPGRYGWVGGTGTAASVLPCGTIGVWLTQRELSGPDDADGIAALLTEAARRDRG
ncbi:MULTISPECIES: serine hydrolase domain-containing protein [unclassified Agrococcus]|uniref:serine hydrolase domain-containing protein n=1 Tax=unclassified Agrococcus TaxID=2615065 RepID=UPI00361BB6E7